MKNKLFIIIFIILFLLAIVIRIQINSSFVSPDMLSITDLQICDSDMLQNDANNSNRLCTTRFSELTTELYVCGEIRSPKRVMDPIYYLYKGNSSKVIYHQSLTRTTNGSFCAPIPLPSDNKDDNYTIKIYYFRQIIATLNFYIQQN